MEILIILFLILLNGVFSMSELALVSSRKFKLEEAAKRGSRSATRALALSEKPNEFLSTVQIGITLIGILTGIFSGEALTDSLATFLGGAEWLAPYARPASVVLVLLAVTYLSIVLGELLPKRIALIFPEKIASAVAGPMSIVSKIAAPFVWLLTKTNVMLLRLLGIKERAGADVSEEEIKSIIRDSTVSGEVQAAEQRIVERVFLLGDRTVADLMTHRGELAWLSAGDTAESVRQKVLADSQPFYPVCSEDPNEVEGIVTPAQLFLAVSGAENFHLADHLIEPIAVHESAAAYHLLEQFQKTGKTYALVVDDYGQAEGFISSDDILRALVSGMPGGMQTARIQQLDNNNWLVDGQMPFFELLDYFKLRYDDTEDGDFSTVAGMVLSHTGTVPKVGDTIRWQEFTIEVTKMDELRVEELRLTR